MPQMLPLNWLLMYLLTIICFFFILKINYFTYKPSFNTSSISFNKKKMLWKW
uniref:ATP synthase complex subunit 8 n=1 Tax=Anisocentropus maculatus TaxID=2904904 RepID=A0A9E8LNP7_9NEOP|nr:ATP synthase F0 subunit 8 [Anisocentropus maculatus]UZZ43756.1 ATP synthase F0 subunit 8 [Anisocentropus maculatus]